MKCIGVESHRDFEIVVRPTDRNASLLQFSRRPCTKASFELRLIGCPLTTAFDDHLVGLIKVPLHRDLVLCNVNQMIDIGIFKDFKLSSHVLRF